VCDPVLGDNGKLYVPAELVKVYKETLVPLAHLLTPNQFELEQLTGVKVTSVDAALKACSLLHSVGVKTVVCFRCPA
jgi:pyridoxine kinase